MTAFLIYVNRDHLPAGVFATRFAQCAEMCVPQIVAPVLTKQFVFEEDGVSCVVVDASDKRSNAVTFAESDDYLCVAFSNHFQYDYDQGLAQRCVDEFRSGGEQSVAKLSNDFSCVLFDRREARLLCINDVLGRSPVRYITSPEATVAGSHDLLLAASGLKVCGPDVLSLASDLSMDYATGSRSLLSEVNQLDAHTWCQIDSKGAVKLLKRISPVPEFRETSRRSRLQVLDRVISSLKDSIKDRVDKSDNVLCDLTGGQDSRTLMALLVASRSSTRVKYKFRGGVDQNDCKVASKLARIYGLSFSSEVPETPTVDESQSHARLLAFYGNGQVNSKRSLDPKPEFSGMCDLHLNGVGAEFFRGYFYKEQFRYSDGHSLDWAVNGLGKYYLPRNIQWRHPEIGSGLRERFRSDLDYLSSELSSDGYDITDMWYLYDRFGYCSGTYSNLPWHQNQWAPFADQEIVKLGMQLAPPIGALPILTDRIMRRFIPRGYWVPTNNGLLLPMPYRYFIKGAISKMKRAARKFNLLKPYSPPSVGNPDRIRNNLMASSHYELLRESLLHQGNWLHELIDSREIDLLLKRHRNRTSQCHNLLGNMWSISTYSSLVGEIQDHTKAAGLQSA